MNNQLEEIKKKIEEELNITLELLRCTTQSIWEEELKLFLAVPENLRNLSKYIEDEKTKYQNNLSSHLYQN